MPDQRLREMSVRRKLNAMPVVFEVCGLFLMGVRCEACIFCVCVIFLMQYSKCSVIYVMHVSLSDLQDCHYERVLLSLPDLPQ